MSIHEAAQYLGLAEESLRYLARAKRIPCGKVGRAWRFNKDDLDEFIRKQYQEKEGDGQDENVGEP